MLAERIARETYHKSEALLYQSVIFLIRLSCHPRTLNVLCAIVSFVLSLYAIVSTNSANATTNELDNDYFSFVVDEIVTSGLPCSAGQMGHILYEDQFVAILEIACESGESYEIIDFYNMENIIIEPVETTDDKQLDNFIDRISHSIA